MMRSRLQAVCTKLTVLLVCCLPFLIPFEAFRNVELQGGVLIVAGVFSWLAIGLRPRLAFKPYDRLTRWLLALFGSLCLVSTIVNPHYSYDLIGAPHIRLGALGLLACIGCGLILQKYKASTFINYLYGLIVALAALSIPYSLLRFNSLHRIAGVFSQADVMAAFLGCGLLLGMYLLSVYPRYHRQLIAAQVFMVVLLGLTETRVVIVGVILLALLWQYQYQRPVLLKRWPVYLLILLVAVVGLHLITPNRLTSANYASRSISYRLDLQKAALRASASRPALGYGPGNLADALDCRKLTAPALLDSCHHGYFFNSSHNIYIDRALAIGWLGGLSYLAIVILALYRGLRAKKEVRIVAYLALLITLYYLTNVTSVTLELLYWVLLLRCLVSRSQPR